MNGNGPSAIADAQSSKERESNALEIKREASGALRNLCIEGSYDEVRLEIARQGGVELLIEQLSATHSLIQQRLEQASLGEAAHAGKEAQNGDASAQVLQRKMEEHEKHLMEALPTAERPLEKMNRKERRHALRAQAIVQQNPQEDATATAPPSEAGRLGSGDPSSAAALRSLALGSLAEEIEVEHILLELQDNLITILWCLSEAADELAIALTKYAPVLARTFSAYVRLALQSQSSSQQSTNNGAPVDKAKKTSRQLIQQLGVSAANALCMLSDENPAFVRVLAGVQPSAEEVKAIQKALKGSASVAAPPTALASGAGSSTSSRKEMLRLQLGLQSEISAAAGIEDLSAIAQAAATIDKTALAQLVSSLSATGKDPMTEETANISMIGMLCAATLRNVSASLPPTSRPRALVSLEAGGSEKLSIAAFERRYVLRKLVDLLQSVELEQIRSAIASTALKAAQEQQKTKELSVNTTQNVIEALNKREGAAKGGEVAMDSAAEGDEADDSEEGNVETMSKARKRAEDVLQIILLGLELLAEILPALGSSTGEDGEGDPDRMREDEAEWMEAGEDGEDGMDAEMEGLVADDHVDGDGPAGDEAMEADTAPADQTKTSSSAGGAFASCFLATAFTQPALTAQLVRLSNSGSDLSLSFPSASTAALAPEQVEPARKGAEAVRQIHLRAISVLSNLLLSLAAAGPLPPSQPAESEAHSTRITSFIAWSTSDAVRPQFEGLWGEIFGIAGRVAEVPAISEAAPSEKNLASEGQDGRALVEHCIGSMWAIARCMRGSLPSQTSPSGPSIVMALQAAYLSSQSDSMRAKAIGTLGCLARAPAVDLETNRSIGNFLVNVVKQVPADGKPKSPTDTSVESMVAALNAIYDVYADENAHYDEPVFVQGGYLLALRQCSGKVRAMVSVRGPKTCECWTYN